MNKNELGRMLSEVDEKHVAELLDTEETTSSVTVIHRRSNVVRWTAIAAAVCLCVVGGGMALGRMQGQTPFAGDPNSQVEDHEPDLEFVFRYEGIPEELLCIDYTLEQKSGSVTESYTPSLPFDMSDFITASAITYEDADSVVHNTAITLVSDKGSVNLILNDFGELFSTRVFPDVSADAQHKKAIIHMYEHPVHENESSYELFYVYDGIGMSMETNGYTAEEAEAFAVALLQNGTTAKEFAFRDYYGYEIVSETVPERKFVEHDHNLHGDMENVDTPVLPFDAALFDTDASFGFDENGEPVYAFIGLCCGDSVTVRLFVDDRGRLYNEDYEVDFSADAKLNYPRVHYYDRSEEMGGKYTERYDFYCRYGDIGYTVLSSDCSFSEVGDNILGSLLKNGATAKSLYEASMNGEIPTESPTEEKGLFGLTYDELPQVRGVIYQTKFNYQLEPYSLPFKIGVDSYTGYGNVRCTDPDSPFYAELYLGNEYRKSIDIRMSQEEGMFGNTPIPENGMEYRGVTLYSYADDTDQITPEMFMTFVLDGTGYTLNSRRMPQEDLFAFVDAIIDNHFTIQDLPLDENFSTNYATLEELRTHEIFAFAAPEHAEIGELRFREDSIIVTAQPNNETDSPEIIHTCCYTYSSDDSGDPISDTAKFLFCSFENGLGFTEKNPTPMDAATITLDSVRSNGHPSVDGRYSFDFIIPMGEYYYEINANCTAEEMWAFLEDILHK